MGRADRMAKLLAERGTVPVSAETLAAVSEAPPVRVADSLTLPLASIRPSPFQPPHRPSPVAIQMVARAIEDAGGLDRLLVEERNLTKLSDEARALAELAADIGRADDPHAHGIEAPLEVRRVAATEHDPTQYELLSGHRRRAAAQLAGRYDAPVVVRDDVTTDAQAAEIVFRRNRLRSDFTSYQEAVGVAALVAQRTATGQPTDSRSLGKLLGYSHTKASELRAIGETLAPHILGELQEVANRFSLRTLRALSKLDSAPVRLAHIRARASLDGGPAATPDRPPTAAAGLFTVRAGQLVLRVPVERMDAATAQQALDELAPLVAKLRKRAKGGNA